jgi:transglutaminase-like putative cysteine protease
MGRRLGQLTGLFLFVLAMARLSRLFETAPDQQPWQLILLATALLGGIAWWLLSQLISSRSLMLAIFGLGAILLALRITAPETMTMGFIPTGLTPPELGEELGIAWRVIRSGIPPVDPHPGIVAILAVVMWVVGALFTWGSTGGPYAALFLPSLVLYLQFAVFDRIEAGPGWMVLASIGLAGAIVSLAMERRAETGRARDTDGRPLARRSAVWAAVMASVLGIASIAVAGSAADVINEYGNAPWRQGDGLGPGPGTGVSYDGLVELRQRVVNQSALPVFTARFAEGTPGDLRPYWRMDTLDTFDGVEWSRSETTSRRYEPGAAIVDEANLYLGTTREILQTIQIQALNSVIVPTAGTPIEIQDPADNVQSPRFAQEFYSVGGVSLAVAGGLSQTDQYQVRTTAIDRTADLGVLATDEDGELSPMFAAAAADGSFPHEPVPFDGEATELADRDRYLDLPERTPPGIFARARSVTAGRATDFEAAWMLQSWFRDSGAFIYSTNVSTGHDALSLDDWLNDPDSENFRTGYCEQFAAAMAVLARALDIPSRVVWGFTPGTVDENGVITVRDTNAHAWVELWIEPYGWYPFDPTPRAEQTGFQGQPPSLTAELDPAEYLDAPVDNPTTNPTAPVTNPGLIEELNTDPVPISTGGISPWWLVAMAALVILVAAIPVTKRIRRRRRLARVREGDITAAWDEIIDRLTDLGVDVSPSMTPLELARNTDHALLPLALSYSSTVYGGRVGQATEPDLVGAEWWLERNFEGTERALAAFSLRSLTRRD